MISLLSSSVTCSPTLSQPQPSSPSPSPSATRTVLSSQTRSKKSSKMHRTVISIARSCTIRLRVGLWSFWPLVRKTRSQMRSRLSQLRARAAFLLQKRTQNHVPSALGRKSKWFSWLHGYIREKHLGLTFSTVSLTYCVICEVNREDASGKATSSRLSWC